ncbi:hypothetical protein [Glutamicibacter arilaitensis]|uniref:hypothetical protein n=1 Tax=Glutamicibacter arilaitensis TaxID=256701 RepID=UPI003A92B1FC
MGNKEEIQRLDSENSVEVTAESAAPAVDELHNPEATLKDTTEEQQREAQMYALTFMKKVLRLKGVRIDREHFLKSELQKRGYSTEVIDRAVTSTPVEAGIKLETLDDIANRSIDFETRKSTTLSFAAGLPGGIAMLGTVPADITQFYVHAFRVMQKIAYVYGWQSFLEETDDIDDETLGLLASFLGVMMGVGGASASLGNFAANVATPAVQRNIAKVALTKTAWYGPMKKTLGIIGINVTKQSFAKTVSKVVPIVGGVISGGMTYVVLASQSNRLQEHLRKLPPPNVNAEEYLASVAELDDMVEEKKSRVSTALSSAGSSMKGAAAGTVDYFREVDLDGDGVPDESRAKTNVKRAMSAAKKAVRRPEVSTSDPRKSIEQTNSTSAGEKIRGLTGNATDKLKSKFAAKRQGAQIPAITEDGNEAE